MAEKGKVKWFSNVKGFGFLRKEGEERDIFVHYSVIQSDGYKRLNPTRKSSFEIVEGEKGPLARTLSAIKSREKKAPLRPLPSQEGKQKERSAAKK